LTNIYKHAFNERKKGTVSFILKEKENKVFISVEDDGPGLPEHFDVEKSGSMGMNIIRILTEQLEGKHQYNSTNNGTIFSLEFEMSDQAGRANARL
jgi:two-component sensor histidine kinase